MSTHVGFTGTRIGMTAAQRASVAVLLGHVGDPDAVCHHGDCIGADCDFHDLAVDGKFTTEAHPPSDNRLRACCVADVIHTPKPYHDRNRDIADASSFLIACPRESREVEAGGTWYTVRYARSQAKPVKIVWPDGGVTL